VKIVIVGPFYPLRGGIAHFGASFAHWLGVRGHRVFPISFSRLYPKFLFPGKSQEESGQALPSYAVVATPLIDSLHPLSWFRAAEHIRHLQPDVVIFTHWLTFFVPCYATLMTLLKRRAHAKLIVLLHNFKPHEARPGDAFLLWLLTRQPDGYLMLSESVKADLLAVQPKAVCQISPHPLYDIFGNAIDKHEARRALGLSMSQKVILFFGYIRPYKGLDLLLDAMPALIKLFPELKLIVAGEFYSDEQAYREKIKSLGIEAHLLLETSYIPSEKVAQYFCAADCAVLPYRSATQSGVVPIAYHFELPVIVTMLAGLRKSCVMGKLDLLLRPIVWMHSLRLSKSFMTCSTRLISKPIFVQKRQKYSWQAFVEAFEQLIVQLEK
jgi:glycosyltransferase involved in cell wall biosynthesis